MAVIFNFILAYKMRKWNTKTLNVEKMEIYLYKVEKIMEIFA